MPDFAKLAEAYGLLGISVERPSEIADALQLAMKNEESSVLNVHVNNEAIVLPIVPAGASNSDMKGARIPNDYFKK